MGLRLHDYVWRWVARRLNYGKIGGGGVVYRVSFTIATAAQTIREASERAGGRAPPGSQPAVRASTPTVRWPLRSAPPPLHRCGQSSCGRVQITSETSDASASADAVEMVVVDGDAVVATEHGSFVTAA